MKQLDGPSLERQSQHCFYSRVFSSRIRLGVRTGLIAAAATGGAIVGFGARHNDWSGPFATLGYQVMQGMGVADAPRLIPTAAGLAAHTSWMVLWGIVFAALSHRKTPAVTALFALLVGLGASFVARSMVPAALGAVKFASMPSVQAALCVALMIAGLLAGQALSRAE